jgi:oligoendopeptidase F
VRRYKVTANEQKEAAMGLQRSLLMVLIALLVSPLPRAQQPERSKIPDQYKWDLTPLYPSDEAWRTAKEKLVAEIPAMRQFHGTLASSPQRLADALETKSRLEKASNRLTVYASLISDEDTRVSRYQAMSQEMVQLAANLGTETAYIEPEILKMDTATIDRFIAQEPRLKVYGFYLRDIERRRDHTLSDGEEKLLSGAVVISSGPYSVFNIFSNAEFPNPSVALSNGQTVKLNEAAYELYRASLSRDDRQKSMSAFFNGLGSYRGTLGSTLNSSVQASVYYAHARKYDTSLDASLYVPNIPPSVYTRILEGVDRNLPAFHRYLKLRKRMLGVPDLHYYDLYAPLGSSVATQYSVDAAERNILEALSPLGPDYAAAARRAFSERWIDMYPAEGKASGGYTSDAYDVHPYILVNYNGKYDDMSTLAHELGHSMHSYFSNKTQPFPLASYATFVAEVASTFNEGMLVDYMLKTTTDNNVKLALLSKYLENIKTTVFRQTQFAEFELRMHEMVEKGTPLTGEALSKLYLEIVRKYYGHDQGVCIVDDYVANEWAYIPHFYGNFYVFQYATSFTASSALLEKVLSGEPGATERYLKFISSGGSKYPIDLLKDAGIDMTTDEPLGLTIRKMNRVMDQIEAILGTGAGVPVLRSWEVAEQ